MGRRFHHRLGRLEAAAAAAEPARPEPVADWDGLTEEQQVAWLAVRFEGWAERMWVSQTDFAWRLEAWKGPFALAPGATEAFRRYWHLNYLGPGWGGLWRFQPGEGAYEEARRAVVGIMRQVLCERGEEGLTCLLEDAVLVELAEAADRLRAAELRGRLGTT